MPVLGKLNQREKVSATCPARSEALVPRICECIADHTSGMEVLVATGPSVSILPPTHEDRRMKHPSFDLLAANRAYCGLWYDLTYL